MKLQDYFSSSHIREHFTEGPLTQHLHGFCQWLTTDGFSRITICHHISQVSHFNRYLYHIGIIDSTDLKINHVYDFFTKYIPNCKNKRSKTFDQKRLSWSINRFLRYMKFLGLLDNFRDEIKLYASLLDEYLEWLSKYHLLASGTLKLRCQYLIKFLDWLYGDKSYGDLSSLTPKAVQDFFLNYSKDKGQSARRSMQAALRTFFRFCIAKGYIVQNLDQAVPTLRTYKLARLPRGIEDEEAQRLLDNIDRSTNSGRRDYAIIQILYTYGVRGGQIRTLRLNDIDWGKNQIRFHPLKHGKESLLPLTDSVGGSLLDYLKYARPQVPYEEVFLTVRAPYHPLNKSTALSEITARQMRKNNIKLPSLGAHTFRHCFASRMLRKGNSLKCIADIIGHRHIQTTFIYTKVDFNILEKVALDLPEN